MAPSVKIIKYVRSPMGKLIKWLFIAFNVLMVLWLGSYWATIGDTISNHTDAAYSAGAAIGSAIGTGLVLTVWVLGDIILGIAVLLTRGTRYEYDAEELKNIETEKPKGKIWTIIAIIILAIWGISNFKKSAIEKPVENYAAISNITSATSSIAPATGSDENERAQLEANKKLISEWIVNESKSEIDDSRLVTVSLEGPVINYSSWEKYTPTLTIRCKEKKTDVFLDVGKMIDPHRDSDFNEYAVARIRYDDEKAFQSNFSISTDNNAFFFRKPVEATKKMFGHKRMIFEFQPYSEGNYVIKFNITDLVEKIKPLREACGW